MGYPVIYILTNKTNGKAYVGLSRKSFKKRLEGHLKNDSYIGKALRKYGLDGFEIQQIAYAAEELNYWEKYFIERLDVRHPWGYNLTAGGEGLVNPSQVVRDKISKKVSIALMGNSYRKDIPHTTISKKAISDGLKNSEKKKENDKQKIGKRLPPWSEESKEKNRQSHIGKPRSDAHLFSERMKKVASQPGYVNPMQGQKRPDLAERNRAGKGRKDSLETLAKKSAASKDKPKSEKHLQSIRIAKAIGNFARAVLLAA